MKAAQSMSGVSSLIAATAAVGDLKTMRADLAGTAPEEIRTDAEVARSAWET